MRAIPFVVLIVTVSPSAARWPSVQPGEVGLSAERLGRLVWFHHALFELLGVREAAFGVPAETLGRVTPLYLWSAAKGLVKSNPDAAVTD